MNRFGWAMLVAIVATVGVILFARGVPSAGEADDPAAPESGGGIALMMPVRGVRPDQLVDSWHDPRGDGTRAHEALDIPAPGGTPVRAAFAGIVVKLFNSAAGGLTAYVRRGDLQAYYAHLSGYAAGLHEGQHVTAGETIAFVGDTGNAGAGNTHLHFAIHRMRSGDGWWQGVPINPYPLLGGAPQ